MFRDIGCMILVTMSCRLSRALTVIKAPENRFIDCNYYIKYNIV